MKVTTVDKGIFRFHDSTHPKWLLGRLVSESYLLQHSQLYSLFRKVYEVRRERHAAQVASTGHSSTAEAVSEADAFYNELLEAFAVDLHARGVHFAMVSMDEWLARRPHVAEKVRELESLGLLDYIGVERCMGEAPVSWSPEGHWDKNTHRAIGLALSRIIEQRYLP
jgi:hypothetical protein